MSLKSLTSGPSFRLVLRSLVAGLTVFLTQLQQSSTWDKSLIEGAITAGILSALEYGTPLNAVVGLGKTAEVVPETK